jgi:hypothetical protein
VAPLYGRQLFFGLTILHDIEPFASIFQELWITWLQKSAQWAEEEKLKRSAWSPSIALPLFGKRFDGDMKG